MRFPFEFPRGAIDDEDVVVVGGGDFGGVRLPEVVDVAGGERAAWGLESVLRLLDEAATVDPLTRLLLLLLLLGGDDEDDDGDNGLLVTATAAAGGRRVEFSELC